MFFAINSCYYLSKIHFSFKKINKGNKRLHLLVFFQYKHKLNWVAQIIGKEGRASGVLELIFLAKLSKKVYLSGISWNDFRPEKMSQGLQENRTLGGDYMTPGRLLRRREFTPVPSHGFTFVYMIPPQNVMPARVTPAWVHPVCCTGSRISLRCEISQWYHVNAKRPPVSVWNRTAGGLERVVHA